MKTLSKILLPILQMSKKNLSLKDRIFRDYETRPLKNLTEILVFGAGFSIVKNETDGNVLSNGIYSYGCEVVFFSDVTGIMLVLEEAYTISELTPGEDAKVEYYAIINKKQKKNASVRG